MKIWKNRSDYYDVLNFFLKKPYYWFVNLSVWTVVLRCNWFNVLTLSFSCFVCNYWTIKEKMRKSLRTPQRGPEQNKNWGDEKGYFFGLLFFCFVCIIEELNKDDLRDREGRRSWVYLCLDKIVRLCFGSILYRILSMKKRFENDALFLFVKWAI